MMSTDSASEEEDDTLRPAFPLPPAPSHPPSGPPQTAEQYLQQVRIESAKLPSVFVAPRRTSTAPTPSALSARLRLPETPAHLCPDPSWQQETLRDFVRLQQQFATLPDREGLELPKRGSWKKWREIVFGNEQQPTDSFVKALGHMRIMEGLDVVDTELDVDEYGERKEDVCEEVAGQLFRGRCAEWVYALLVGVEMPISGDTASTIRSLLRKMMIARLALESKPDDGNLARVNVLITILEKHFGQGDTS